MWQYMYETGYGLMANTKFCKQLIYKLKSKMG